MTFYTIKCELQINMSSITNKSTCSTYIYLWVTEKVSIFIARVRTRVTVKKIQYIYSLTEKIVQQWQLKLGLLQFDMKLKHIFVD